MSGVPDGGDAYVLESVIHDWHDETALTILRNERTHARTQGECAKLLAQAGFRLDRVVRTATRHRSSRQPI
ncbi:methyltransferase [Mycolicibacterium hippocampi]|uniref:O-methyltransferase C-terminal domain-containing protein n=1 Tax=Mycolicibacterium hippocampi TaxID=659824 RepID=A0A7I9ZNU2_9MYCO|nr:methyltransferase [Mycolicibacterium hippocampi]GFH02721.1 hypothetical protein MHIP_32040 [Mycolicibacterium hippocampi]